MREAYEVRQEINAIIKGYNAGECVICKGKNDLRSQINIYELHWDCYKLINLLLELDKIRE